MSNTQPTRMTQARLERVQALRREIAELSSNARALGNDAADPWRQTALRDVADTLTHAARSLNALLDRDAALPHAAPGTPLMRSRVDLTSGGYVKQKS